MEQLSLPAAQVVRAIKEALPSGYQASKDVKELLNYSSGIFILYLTHAAMDGAKPGAALTKDDILRAVKDCNFEFEPELKEWADGNTSSKKRKKPEGKSKASAKATKKAKVAQKEESSEEESSEEESSDDEKVEASEDKGKMDTSTDKPKEA